MSIDALIGAEVNRHNSPFYNIRYFTLTCTEQLSTADLHLACALDKCSVDHNAGVYRALPDTWRWSAS